jgi:hypothetical protein
LVIALGVVSQEESDVVVDATSSSIIPVPDDDIEVGSDSAPLSTADPGIADRGVAYPDDQEDGEIGVEIESGAKSGSTDEITAGVEVGSGKANSLDAGRPVEFAASAWIVRTLTIGWASPDGWAPVRYVITVRWSNGEKTIKTTKESVAVKGAGKTRCTIVVVNSADRRQVCRQAPSFVTGSEELGCPSEQERFDPVTQ